MGSAPNFWKQESTESSGCWDIGAWYCSLPIVLFSISVFIHLIVLAPWEFLSKPFLRKKIFQLLIVFSCCVVDRIFKCFGRIYLSSQFLLLIRVSLSPKGRKIYLYQFNHSYDRMSIHNEQSSLQDIEFKSRCDLCVQFGI